MKIVYLLSTLRRSGPVNILYNIVKFMNEDVQEICIITLSPEPENSRLKDFKAMGIKVISLNLSRIKGIFFLKKIVEDKIRKINPDIVHSHGLRSDRLNIEIGKSFKTCSTVHNFPKYDYKLKFGVLRGFIYASYHLAILKKSANPVACSKTISELFKKHHGISMKYIQNGVDTEEFIPVEEETKLKLKDNLKVPKGKFVFISVGSLITRKNMACVVRGFLSSGVADNSVLLIAGEGPEYNTLKILTEENHNIKLLGNVNNVKDYLQVSDYFISASLAEGLPNTVIEAMSSGLPVILSDIPPHREIIEYDSSLQHFFKPVDYIDLSKNIDFLTTKPVKILCKKSRELVCENLSALKMAEKYYMIYKEICRNE